MGNGNQIDIFNDKWNVGLELLANHPTKPGSEHLLSNLGKVKDVTQLEGERIQWKRELITTIWEDHVASYEVGI